MKASRESVAYRLDAASPPAQQLDTSRFEAPERKKPARTAQRATAERPATRGRSTAQKARKKKPVAAQRKKTKKGARIRQRIRLVTPARLFCAVFAAVLCVGLIYSQMMLTVATHKLSDSETQLKTLESEHVSLMSKYEQQYNADYIAEYAENTLGMVKLNPSQIEYIELAGEEGIEVSSSAPATGGLVGSLVRGFTALLEYLR
ncbi:MAG TPA: hypothetical protein H9707_09120 [Candidatus Butyricicoccus avicola]|nr:hypothetical protein [Candidatus Butyricicoccus avicola]